MNYMILQMRSGRNYKIPCESYQYDEILYHQRVLRVKGRGVEKIFFLDAIEEFHIVNEKSKWLDNYVEQKRDELLEILARELSKHCEQNCDPEYNEPYILYSKALYIIDMMKEINRVCS